MRTPTNAARKAARPATEPADVCQLVLVIRGESYAATPNPNAPGLAWRLRKGRGAPYDVTGRECSCADFQFRQADRDSDGCKHQRALRAVGLLPPADAAIEDDPTDPDNGDPAGWPEWTDGHAYATTRR